MTSSKTSAPLALCTNHRNGHLTYGVSTYEDEGSTRRVCMSNIPRNTTVDDILAFFPEGSVEGLTIKKTSYPLAFVQFFRPADFTEAILRNENYFLGGRVTIRHYVKEAARPRNNVAKRRAFERQHETSSQAQRGSPVHRDRSPERVRSSDTARSPARRDRSRERTPVRVRTPVTSRTHRSPHYKSSHAHVRSRSPVRERAPSRSLRDRSREPASRSRGSERSGHHDERKRSSERARSRSADRESGHKRQRERSPSLDRNISRRPDPFLNGDLPNPSEEMFMRQHYNLMKLQQQQQQQQQQKIPMQHAFGTNGAPLPGYGSTAVSAHQVAYTQASQASYVTATTVDSGADSGVVATTGGGSLFEGHLQRIFSEAQSQMQLSKQQMQQTLRVPLPPATSATSSSALVPTEEIPQGVELILKLILDYKSARHLSLFQLDSVLDYLQETKRLIQEPPSASSAVAMPRAIEAAPPVSGGDIHVGSSRSSPDLRQRLDQHNDSKAYELASKIRRCNGLVKEERDK